MGEPAPLQPEDRAVAAGPGPADSVAQAARARFRRRAWLVLLVISIAVLALDQATKYWAHHTLRLAPQSRVTLVDDFVLFSYVRNPGAAWGFLAHAQESFRHPFFLAISLAAMAFILFIHSRLEPGQGLLLVAVSLVMGGALGNFIDRVRLHYVIDFIELHWRHRYHWPTFNVADVAISTGVAMLLLEMLFGPWWRRRRRGAA